MLVDIGDASKGPPPISQLWFEELLTCAIASERTILDVHLIPASGDRTLDTIGTEDDQGLKAKLAARSPKTATDVLLR